MKWFAQIGLVSRGVVYLLMGVLALMVVLHRPEGRNTDPKGALRELLSQPLGYIFVIILAVGLCCYAIWRIFEAIDNSEHFARDWKGYGLRIGGFSSALVHLALGYYAFNLVFLFSKDHVNFSERKLARWILGFHNGDVALAAVGAGILAFGAGQIVIAVREYFLDIVDIPGPRKKFLLPICKFGLGARGFVFMVVGVFFMEAAYFHDSHEAGGLKQAWAALAKQSFGWAWVTVVAMGLIAYAFYCAVEARYRRRV